MFQQAVLEKLDGYFVPLSGRPGRCVYFYRLTGVSPQVTAFLKRYYEAARQTGVVLDGQLQNPDTRQLGYFSEMMGTAFRQDRAFLSAQLARWLPRMSVSQREAVAEAMASLLAELGRQGKNEGMLRNAYTKYMCWLYYRFERMVNRLGAEEVPKILYDGALSQYALQFLTLLSKAGADILLLDRTGGYDKLDPASACSRLYAAEGLTPFPPEFSLKQIQSEIGRDLHRQQLYGAPPSVSPCTNAWMQKPSLESLLVPAQARGNGAGLFYNAFIAQYGVEDKLTYAGSLFALYSRLKAEKRRICVASAPLPLPAPDEIAAIRRQTYRDPEQLAGELAKNIQAPGGGELQRLMVRAFLDIVLEEAGRETLPRMTNAAVYLLCWLRRYQKELFDRWKMPETGVFLYFGTCATVHEARFLRLLARLPVDVAVLQPDLNGGSCLQDASLLELRREESLSLDAFPVEAGQIRVSTAAYQAERDLDGTLYQDTGLYRSQQYAKAETVTLRSMYEEIALLWDQEVKYRPTFQVVDGVVTVPVLLEKVCGVKDGDVQRYWLDIKKLLTPDTLLLYSLPWLDPRRPPDPMRACATQFLRDGRLLKDRIKNHKDYPFGILRPEMQDHLLDKLQLLLDRRLIAGTYQNGTEYTIISTVLTLHLNKELLRLIQRFDFTKKNPKLVVLCTTEAVLSLEDSILFAFLNLVGFDILFFVPTGYQCIERHFQHPFANEQQIGEYLYDLRPPNFAALPDRERNPIRRIFGIGRSH